MLDNNTAEFTAFLTRALIVQNEAPWRLGHDNIASILGVHPNASESEL
jgi:hypothetical protein